MKVDDKSTLYDDAVIKNLEKFREDMLNFREVNMWVPLKIMNLSQFISKNARKWGSFSPQNKIFTDPGIRQIQK